MASAQEGEKSRQKILDMAKILFFEKGYDNTSINDIVKGIGMTKGTLYHHFSSKQQILETLLQEQNQSNLFEVADTGSGIEKLRSLLRRELKNLYKQKIGYVAMVFMQTPRLIGEYYLTLQNQVIPLVQNLMREGQADGSIPTRYPDEVAELLILYSDLIIGLQLGTLGKEQAQSKFLFLATTLDSLGVPLFNEDLLNDAFHLIEFLKNG